MTAREPSASPAPGAATQAPHRTVLLALLVALVAVKLAWLLGDHSLRFFMGDSAAYFNTAITGWGPPDRSFTYGWMVRVAAIWPGSALTLLAAQTLAGIATCLLLALLLWQHFGVRPWLAAMAALLLAVEPAQLLYERMMMTESAGGLAFAAFVVLLAQYAASTRLRWMAAAAVFGIAAISLRFSLLPVVLGMTATVPVVAVLCSRGRRSQPVRLLLHLGFAALATIASHGAYTTFYGALHQTDPTYLPSRGMMRIGLVAPMVRPEHFEGTGVPGSVLSEVTIPLDDPRKREAHVWDSEGLFLVIARYTTDPQAVARKVTARALRDRPGHLLVMGLDNSRGFLEPAVHADRTRDDLGRRPPNQRMIEELREYLGYDAEGVAASDSWVTHWFTAGAPWLVACYFLLAPLALVMLALSWRKPTRPVALVLCLACLGLVSGLFLFAHVPTPRYLYLLPFHALATLAVIGQSLLPRSRDQGPGVAR